MTLVRDVPRAELLATVEFSARADTPEIGDLRVVDVSRNTFVRRDQPSISRDMPSIREAERQQEAALKGGPIYP